MSLLYNFMRAEYAKTNIEQQRLKIAKVEELNDPFEFRPGFDWDPDPDSELAELAGCLETTRAQLATLSGLLCFSASWRHPLMWGHYACSHEGICLGFEFTGRKDVRPSVVYTTERPVVRLDDLKKFGNPDSGDEKMPEVVKRLHATFRDSLFHKHLDWKYEQERRLIVNIRSPPPQHIDEDGNLFAPWNSNDLVLREVILGANCIKTPSDVEKWLTGQTGVKIFKAKLHNSEFEMNRAEGVVDSSTLKVDECDIDRSNEVT
jgi:hypothetical protein